jgi:hypothetical protein
MKSLIAAQVNGEVFRVGITVSERIGTDDVKPMKDVALGLRIENVLPSLRVTVIVPGTAWWPAVSVMKK